MTCKNEKKDTMELYNEIHIEIDFGIFTIMFKNDQNCIIPLPHFLCHFCRFCSFFSRIQFIAGYFSDMYVSLSIVYRYVLELR